MAAQFMLIGTGRTTPRLIRWPRRRKSPLSALDKRARKQEQEQDRCYTVAQHLREAVGIPVNKALRSPAR